MTTISPKKKKNKKKQKQIAYDQRRITLHGPAQGDAEAVVVLDLLQKPRWQY